MNRIREARKAKSLTMKELGQLIGVSESAISMYETFKREPDNATLISIANALDVSVDYLLCLSEQIEIKKQPIAQSEELDTEIIDLFKRLSDRNYQRAVDFAQGLLTAQEESSSAE